MPEDKEVTGCTGKGDGVIMYPTAQLVSWRSLPVHPEANSLASCLASPPLLQNL